MSKYKKYEIVYDARNAIVYGTEIKHTDNCKLIMRGNSVVASLSHDTDVFERNDRTVYDELKFNQLMLEDALDKLKT